MNIHIPTPLVNLIYESINQTFFIEHNEIDRKKIFINAVTLWLKIFEIQNNSDKEHNYYVNISREQFNKFYFKLNGKKYGYKPLLDILVNAGILEINDKYSAGSFSKSYRIKFNFTGDLSTTEIDIDLEKIFVNIKEKKYWLNKYPEYSHLIEDCYRTKIELNNYVNYLYENKGNKLKYKLKNGFLVERYLTDEKILDYILRAIKVNVGNIWFGMSDQGRFYSSIASLPSNVTDFLLLDNRSVESYDIANCQPLLLSSLLNNNEYKKDVIEGKLYEKLGKIIYGEYNADIKQKVKLMVMVRFFDDKQIQSGMLYEALSFLYKGLVDEINKLKENNKIAHLTHKIESDIMVKGVGGLYVSKLLKHDEVLVHKENKEFVKNYIENYIKMIIKK